MSCVRAHHTLETSFLLRPQRARKRPSERSYLFINAFLVAFHFHLCVLFCWVCSLLSSIQSCHQFIIFMCISLTAYVHAHFSSGALTHSICRWTFLQMKCRNTEHHTTRYFLIHSRSAVGTLNQQKIAANLNSNLFTDKVRFLYSSAFLFFAAFVWMFFCHFILLLCQNSHGNDSQLFSFFFFKIDILLHRHEYMSTKWSMPVHTTLDIDKLFECQMLIDFNWM